MRAALTPPGEALLLRRWALELLGAATGPDERSWQRALACDPESWELFLRKERCASPLQHRLRQTGTLDRLPDRAASVLRVRALYELKRVLSARSHLATIAELADARGWKMILLKGGMAVAAGEQIYLADVDILVEPERTEEVAAALAEAGFTAAGADHSTSHHLAARVQPHALPVEIHRFVRGIAEIEEFRARAAPLERHPPLWRLSPVDHLRYMLVHITSQHPERAGRIRDLLLIAHALGDCSPADMASVEAELEGHDRAATIRRVIDAARDLEARAWRSDPFEHHALCTYIAADLRIRNHLQRHLYSRALLLAVTRRPWRREYQSYRARRSTLDLLAPMAWLRRHLPPLSRAVRDILHLPLFLAATGIAGAFRWEARRISGLVGQVSDQPARSGQPASRQRMSRAGSR